MARFGNAASVVALVVALGTSGPSLSQSAQTNYTFDVHGRLVNVTRPASTTQYTYDNANNRTRVVTTQNNAVPVANPDSLTAVAGAAGVTINPLSNDTDADTDPLSVTGVSSAAQGKGSTSYTANSVTYTANSGTSGTDSFTYTVSDGKGGLATGSVTVNIQAVIAPPVAGPFTVTITPNANGDVAAYSLPLSFSGGAPTSVSVASQPAAGTGQASLGGGNSILYSSTGWSGQTSLQYTGANSGGSSAPATATLLVRPVAGDVTGLSAAPGQTKTVNLSPYLKTSGVTALSLPGGPYTQQGQASINGTTLTYTANANASGADTFAYVATSAGGASAPANITFNVSVAPPSASSTNTTVAGNTANNVLPLAISGSPTSVALYGGQPNNGYVSTSGTTMMFTPNSGWSGQTSLHYTASNSGGASAPATVNISVTPVVGNVSATVTEGVQQAISLSPLTNYDSISISGYPKASYYISGSTLYYTASPGTGGSGDYFVYQATSPGGVSNSAQVNITINAPPNRNPVATQDYATITANSYAYFDPRTNDSDPDGDPLTLVSVTAPQNGSAWTNANNYISYVPNSGWSGTDYFYYTISDGHGGSTQSWVQVTVTPPPTNNNPVATQDYATIAANSYAYFDPRTNDYDPDGDPLTLVSVTAPQNGSAWTNANNYISYVPNSGWSGTDYFYYTVSDGRGGSTQSWVQVSVTPPPPANNPPTANPATTDPVWQTTTAYVDPTANDSDPEGDALTVQSIDSTYCAYAVVNGASGCPSNIGSVYKSGNTLVYSAPFLTSSGSPGSSYMAVVVWYTVSDGRSTSQSYQVFNVYGPQ